MVIYNVWELKVYTDMRYDNSQPIVHINKKKNKPMLVRNVSFFIAYVFQVTG